MIPLILSFYLRKILRHFFRFLVLIPFHSLCYNVNAPPKSEEEPLDSFSSAYLQTPLPPSPHARRGHLHMKAPEMQISDSLVVLRTEYQHFNLNKYRLRNTHIRRKNQTPVIVCY